MVKSTDFLLKTPTKFTKIESKKGNLSSTGKLISEKSNEGLKFDEKTTLLEDLPKNSDLL